MGKFKFDVEGRKLLRALSLKIEELDAHVVVFSESILATKEEDIKDSTGVPADTAREQLDKVATALSHTITKVTIAWKDEISLKELGETTQEVELALTSLIQVYKALVAMNVTAGLWGDMVVLPLQKTIQGILADVGTLVSDFYSLKKTKEELKKKGPATNKGPKSTGKEKELERVSPVTTGLVWEGCKGIKTIPLDNVSAAALELKLWTDTAKDAMDEMKEVSEALKQKDAPGEEKNKDEDDDSDKFSEDEFDDDDDEDWTEEERKVLPGLLALLRCSYGLLNGINSLLEKNVSATKTAAEGVKQCKWLKEIIAHGAVLMKHVDDLSVCAYPPQQKEVIKLNFTNLVQHIQDLYRLVNTNEELKTNARCIKMGEVVNMLLESAQKQMEGVLDEKKS